MNDKQWFFLIDNIDTGFVTAWSRMPHAIADIGDDLAMFCGFDGMCR